MAASYDNSAWFYDRLSRLVYGSALIDAQVYLLQFIPPGSNILIVGGGAGWILNEIAKKHPAGLKITYVEIAPKMMALSKKQNTGGNEVTFINDAIENVLLSPGFDVAVTPFLFDNFREETLQKVFGHIHCALKPGGLWLDTDFQLSGKWWQNVLLKSMFVFFRLICNIEATKLPGIEQQFIRHGYKTAYQQSFFGGFVTANVYHGC